MYSQAKTRQLQSKLPCGGAARIIQGWQCYDGTTVLITPTTPISVASATMKMNPHGQTSFASTALLMSLTYVPVFLSTLSFYPELFATHPIQRFLLGLAPWWMAYLSARWYVRLAEQSSSLYHPLGCLAQCCAWVFHWVVSLYHAYFGKYHTVFVELALNVLPLVKPQSTPYGHTSSPYRSEERRVGKEC